MKSPPAARVPGAMWTYIHARTVARVWPRLRRQVGDDSAAVDRFLKRVIEARGSFSILQVGAYDGVSNDPLHDVIHQYAHVRAVLLEPQPAAHAALEALWRGNERVTPLRLALADACGERPLYVIAEGSRHLHPFADQIVSFNRSHVESGCSRYVWRPSVDLIASIPVPTVDWSTLARQYGPFDLVSIDVEGDDGEIIHQMDLSDAPPDIIRYEHRHLTRDMRVRCVDRLERAGYVVKRINKADSLAIRAGVAVSPVAGPLQPNRALTIE